jgi:hypothetical protein
MSASSDAFAKKEGYLRYTTKTMGRSALRDEGTNSDLPDVMLVQISTTTIPITVDLACHRHIRSAQCAPDDPGELSGALYRR